MNFWFWKFFLLITLALRGFGEFFFFQLTDRQCNHWLILVGLNVQSIDDCSYRVVSFHCECTALYVPLEIERGRSGEHFPLLFLIVELYFSNFKLSTEMQQIVCRLFNFRRHFDLNQIGFCSFFYFKFQMLSNVLRRFSTFFRSFPCECERYQLPTKPKNLFTDAFLSNGSNKHHQTKHFRWI